MQKNWIIFSADVNFGQLSRKIPKAATFGVKILKQNITKIPFICAATFACENLVV